MKNMKTVTVASICGTVTAALSCDQLLALKGMLMARALGITRYASNEAIFRKLYNMVGEEIFLPKKAKEIVRAVKRSDVKYYGRYYDGDNAFGFKSDNALCGFVIMD